jgi:hypothetical protein
MRKVVPNETPICGLGLLAVFRDDVFEIVRGTLPVFIQNDFNDLGNIITVLKFQSILKGDKSLTLFVYLSYLNNTGTLPLFNKISFAISQR